MKWRKFGLGLLVAFLVLSTQLIAVPQAVAMSADNASVTFRRAVVAWHDEKGRLQMNITWINRTIDFANLSNSHCACHNSSSCSSNVTANVNVSVATLYNMTEKDEQLLFFGINIYNETFNYTMYALVYKAERSQYNFTLITRIFTDPETGEYRVFVTGMNIAPREDKALPVGDTILTAENLTLSEYYWTLNEVLLKLHKNDETKWIWTRSAYELRHLSHLVRLKLPEYNGKANLGYAIVIDDYSACVHLCDLSCTGLFTLACIAAAGSSGGVLSIICFAGSFICSGLCAAMCGEDFWTSIAKGGTCSAGCSEILKRLCASKCGILGSVCADACGAVLAPMICPQICDTVFS
ncbi:hypothetical protein NF865_07880 [Thermococcus aggregans]|uniref:Uncharacterized protein n=1 Tax=Thermococcus aggregans TaxID=110163 RepID=A0A9E7SNB9_THEAG|nr:hypothetical protein [Thermococcus aggregans]USS40240.1 hypothetical protein NF865_07880 [Thermococcus aggregans]